MKKLILSFLVMLITLTGISQTTKTYPVTDKVTLTGTSGDDDGFLVKKVWTQETGATVNIETPNQDTTIVSGFKVAGSYRFRFTVTDNQGATWSDTTNVTALPPNKAPHASAGVNVIIQLPKDESNNTTPSTSFLYNNKNSTVEWLKEL